MRIDKIQLLVEATTVPILTTQVHLHSHKQTQPIYMPTSVDTPYYYNLKLDTSYMPTSVAKVSHQPIVFKKMYNIFYAFVMRLLSYQHNSNVSRKMQSLILQNESDVSRLGIHRNLQKNCMALERKMKYQYHTSK